MEYASNGSLQNYLKSRNTSVGKKIEKKRTLIFFLIMKEWNLRFKWCIELIEVLLYLHSHNIIHRDLRCVNILVMIFFFSEK